MAIDAGQILSHYQQAVGFQYFLVCKDDDSYAQFNTPENNNAFVEFLISGMGTTGDPRYQQVLRGDAPEAVVQEVFTEFMGSGERCPENSTFKMSEQFRLSVEQAQRSGLLDGQTVQVSYSDVTRAMEIPPSLVGATSDGSGQSAQTVRVDLFARTRAVPAPDASSESQLPGYGTVLPQAPQTSQDPQTPFPLLRLRPPAVSRDPSAFAATQLGVPTVAPGRPSGSAQPGQVRPQVPDDILAIGEAMRYILPTILDTFEKSSNAVELYEAWGFFRTQYLTAMSEISERLFLTDPSGRQHPSSQIFSSDPRTRSEARDEIVQLATYAEGFAQYVLEKAGPAFLEKLDVSQRALFMAQYRLIENLRQKALQLREGVHPQNNISDTRLKKHVQAFDAAWAFINNPERYADTVLSSMRTYLKEQRGVWKNHRIWRLRKITISSTGNTSTIPNDRKWLMYNIFDRIVIEASTRDWTRLNAEINWDGRERRFTITSTRPKLGRLLSKMKDNGFGEMIATLGGQVEKKWSSAWRRINIPFDPPEETSFPPSVSSPGGSLPSLGSRQGTSSSYGMGAPSFSGWGRSYMWSDEPITAAGEQITAYEPPSPITAYVRNEEASSGDDNADSANAWYDSYEVFFGAANVCQATALAY